MLKQRPNIRLSHRYRYAEDINENGIVIQLIKFVELSKTPKGAWVKEHNWFGDKRFVLDGTGKRYCHETKKMAWDAFKLRKAAHLRHATNSMNMAKYALETATALDAAPEDTINVGRPAFWEKFTFD